MLARVLRVAAVSLALGGAGFAALAQTGTTPPADAGTGAGEDPVVAKVNGAEIKRSEVMRTIASLPPQVQQMPVQMIFPAVIDQIINGKLVAEAGYKNNVQNDPEVAERMKRAEERIVQELYLTQEVQKRITAERLQEAYNQFKQENPPQDEVKASHILVESEDAAKAIIADLKKGGDFAKIAGEKSTDKAAAQQGGDLGFFTKDQMVEPFANAAFAMKPGDVSETPVQTQFGWHVIKVVERRQSTPPTFEEVQEQLRSQVSEQVIGELVEDLRSDARVERFQMDGSPMPEQPAATPGSAAPGAAPAPRP
ncbi:peptidylprolyl isomerase [Skermanella sp. TT6]|uniref:Parvulin-like PPIase n=1 Tax=Skermanella cutis TaxID=2775420 RepID=A0ABX7BB62_9PROT|nr:peptidylprolyl isomerase [Skermanella sp. TT6]QQP90301.1 peptidylprolyl isomerase [Skermanella sp. TT6]